MNILDRINTILKANINDAPGHLRRGPRKR